MYTQCPDCSTAFRVTAGVLKQAAGQVRCGGCGHAFNALEYLSEDRPEQPARKEAEIPLPELTPEPMHANESPPAAISAEQSAALLKTLDELAGSDIRIEDTGVEWRVLDEDAISDSLDDESEPHVGDSGIIVDELLDESPTPIDQFLTKTPNDIEASEIFAESANLPAQTPVDELRFDDNTPLPDDFDLDDESSYSADPIESPVILDPETAVATDGGLDVELVGADDHSPTDVALGDDDGWADILGEFAEPFEPPESPSDGGPEALAPTGSAGDDDARQSASAAADTPPDVDTQFALQAEAMGIDLSGLRARPTGEYTRPTPGQTAGADESFDTRAVDVAKASAEEAPTADRDAEMAAAPGHATGERPQLGSTAKTDDAPGLVLAAETDDEPGLVLAAETDDEPGLDPDAETGEAPALDLSAEIGEQQQAGFEVESEQEHAETPAGLTPEDPDSEVQASFQDADADNAPLEFGSIDSAMRNLEEQSDVFGDGFFGRSVDERQDDGRERAARDRDPGFPADDEITHYVPPQSEEELTLNLLIDRELMSFAVEDEDGFASTIVVPEKGAEAVHSEMQLAPSSESAATGFESIIMEGDFVRSALDKEKRAADMAAAAELAALARAARETDGSRPDRGRKRGMVLAAILLSLVLVFQVVHQSREALATIPAFNDTVGPLYLAIGKPLTPTWDVTGWRFEARRDVLDDEAKTLTIISRIGNTSSKPLPYPLINVTLTDRFEETVGNRTLDPAEYLANDLDPRELVGPGTNFTAVMSIESPSDAATGYKLQACYRLTDARLRCHVPDFK